MEYVYIEKLTSDGDSYVEYEIKGFNSKNDISITCNNPYLYNNHKFLYSFIIKDDFTRIIFSLKKGLDAYNYLAEIEIEMERICFNLITYESVSVFQPIWFLKKIKTNQKKSSFEEKILFYESLDIKIRLSSSEFYSSIISGKNLITDSKKRTIYKFIFDILQTPNLVIQYMTLYDLLKKLVSKNSEPIQRDVIEFFERYKNKYTDVTWEASRKCKNKKEDCFTYLRNQISHSQDLSAGIIKGLDVNERKIKYLVRVINDILCEQVE